MPHLRLAIGLLAALGAAFPVHATDTYEGSGVLQIPALTIGSATYSDVVLTVNLPLVRGPTGTMAVGTEDSYDPATNQLVVPAVTVGTSTFYNAVVTVNQLTSIGSVSGADTFDGTNLVLRNVQVGAQSFHDVTLHVGLSNVASVGHGLPGVSSDQYDAATGKLTIGAVQVGAKVYTNVVLNVGLGNVASVAGYVERVLYGFPNGAGGADPVGGLVMDASGNLYGTTSGTSNSSGGTVFRLSPNGSGGYTETTLYTFTNGADGGNPLGGVVLDASGNLYGTTASGGSSFSGTVFKLSAVGDGTYTESVLYSFAGGTDGFYPHAGLVMDAGGNLYGTTQFGGAASMGTVFRLAPSGSGNYTESVIYSFLGATTDGSTPEASLILDAYGNLYGTTFGGGSSYGGTVFKLTPGSGGYTETVLYNFTGGNDGGNPVAALVLDTSGNLYGTTSTGGTVGGGTAFKLTAGSGTFSESVLHSFGAAFEDSVSPVAGLILDASGNLYGTASNGGVNGRGTVFKLTPAGSGSYTESILYNFQGSPDGNAPEAALLMDASGNLFGTTTTGGTASGGSSYGAVFEIE